MIDAELVLQQRLHGKPVRAIAKQLKCSVGEVNEILDQLGETITNEYKVRTVAVELERLEAMQSIWFQKCQAGDYYAGLLCLKIAERLSSLLSLESKFDVIEIRAAAAPAVSGSDKVYAALARLTNGNGNGSDTNAPPQ